LDFEQLFSFLDFDVMENIFGRDNIITELAEKFSFHIALNLPWKHIDLWAWSVGVLSSGERVRLPQLNLPTLVLCHTERKTSAENTERGNVPDKQ